jgi:hypothetical protein
MMFSPGNGMARIHYQLGVCDNVLIVQASMLGGNDYQIIRCQILSGEKHGTQLELMTAGLGHHRKIRIVIVHSGSPREDLVFGFVFHPDHGL